MFDKDPLYTNPFMEGTYGLRVPSFGKTMQEEIIYQGKGASFGGAEENYITKEGTLDYHEGIYKGMGMILDNSTQRSNHTDNVKKLLTDLHESLMKNNPHKIEKIPKKGGALPLAAMAPAAAGAVGNAISGIFSPITEAVRSKSNWDYRGRELEENRKSKDQLIRLMAQETDPDRRLEYAKMIYSIV